MFDGYSRKKARFFLLLFLIFSFALTNSGFGYWIWSPESGKFVSSDSQVSEHADELYQHALSFRKQNQEERAIEELQNLIRRYPQSTIAPEAQYQIGISFEQKGEYRLAFEAYKKLLKDYPQSDRAPEVVERLFKMGNLFLAGRKEKVVGISMAAGAPKAIEIFEYIVEAAPFSAYGDQAQFHAGLAYKQTREYRKAMEAFQKVIENYPNSTLLDDVRYQLAETSYEFSRAGSRDERAIDEAIENISDFLNRYPESSVSEKVGKLKQEIAKRDAEKNYRIGLYYESQHEFESAAFYYEDVVKRYPDTEYGKQATEKLATLKAPIAKMRREERDIAIDIDATTAKLKSLKEERQALSGKEPTVREKELQKEIEALTEKKRVLSEDRVEGVREREKAHAANVKAWKTKWKSFEKKQKEMRRNQAPELARAFESWKASLLEEREKLAAERDTIRGLESTLKQKEPEEETGEAVKEERGEKEAKPKKRKASAAESYGIKDLRKIREEEEDLGDRLNQLEKRMVELVDQLSAVDYQGFASVREEKDFNELLGKENQKLKDEDSALAKERQNINTLISQFETKKSDYKERFNSKDVEGLVLEKSLQNLKTSKEFKESGVSLENSLDQLKQKKAKLSESWIEQKKSVDSISALFAETKETEPKKETLAEEERMEIGKYQTKYKDLDTRTLRKRIKYLEREIRSRLEEIEDWNEQKNGALEKLKGLIEEERSSVVSKVAKPLTAPARFLWWFVRSAAFGLSDEDKKLMKQAERYKKNVSTEEASEIRKLQEEIELESLLIQGRYEEVRELKKELEGLQLVAAERNIHMTPILIEKDFAVGDESLRSAVRMVTPETHQEILIGRLNEETERLKSIEDQIEAIDQKMAEIDAAIGSSKSKKKQAEEPKPESDEPEVENTPEEANEQRNLLSEIKSLKEKIENKERDYESAKQKLENSLFAFYQDVYLQKPVDELSGRQKDVRKRREGLEKKRQELDQEIWKQKASQKNLLLAEKEILEKHSKNLEKKIGRAKNEEKELLSVQLESVKSDLSNVSQMLGQLQAIKE